LLNVNVSPALKIDGRPVPVRRGSPRWSGRAQVRGYPAVASPALDCCDPAMAEFTDPFVDSGDRSSVEAMFWDTLTGDETPPLVRKD